MTSISSALFKCIYKAMADGSMIVVGAGVLSCLNQQNRLELKLRYLLRGQFCGNDYHIVRDGGENTNKHLIVEYLLEDQPDPTFNSDIIMGAVYKSVCPKNTSEGPKKANEMLLHIFETGCIGIG